MFKNNKLKQFKGNCYLFILTLFAASGSFGHAEETNYAKLRYRIYEIQQYSIDSLKDYQAAHAELNRIFRSCDYVFLDAYRIALHNIFCNLGGSWETYQEDIKFYIEKLAPFYQPITLNTWLMKTKQSRQEPQGVKYEKITFRPGLSLFYWGCADKPTQAQMKKHIAKCIKRSENSIDKVLTQELLRMEKQDQQARNIRNMEKSDAAMERIDRQNQEKLDSIIARYHKIPGIREVGNAGLSAVEILLSHIGYDWLHAHMPLIEQGILSGDLNPERMAWIVDYNFHHKYLSIVDGKVMIPYCRYGSLISNESEANPIKDLNQTNNLRRNWGLPPVEYYWHEQGATYNPKAFLEKHHFEMIDTDKD